MRMKRGAAIDCTSGIANTALLVTPVFRLAPI